MRGQRVTVADDFVGETCVAQQRLERGGYLQHNTRALRTQQRQIAHKLQCIAKALFCVHEYRAATHIFPFPTRHRPHAPLPVKQRCLFPPLILSPSLCPPMLRKQ